MGSGKSSLLSSLIGDLQYIDTELKDEIKDKMTNDEEVQEKLTERAQRPIEKMEEKPIKIFESISYVQ